MSGPEIADDTPRQRHALAQLQQNAEVAPQPLAVETGHGKPYDFVACLRHTLHLHTPQGADKEDFGVGPAASGGIGDGNGREDMTARASAAYQYSFLAHS